MFLPKQPLENPHRIVFKLIGKTTLFFATFYAFMLYQACRFGGWKAFLAVLFIEYLGALILIGEYYRFYSYTKRQPNFIDIQIDKMIVSWGIEPPRIYAENERMIKEKISLRWSHR